MGDNNIGDIIDKLNAYQKFILKIKNMISTTKDKIKTFLGKVDNFLLKISPGFLKKSNRYKHFFYSIPIGFVFGELCVLGLASGMEFKDKQTGGKWDWLDWLYTILGGAIGQGVFYLLFGWLK